MVSSMTVYSILLHVLLTLFYVLDSEQQFYVLPVEKATDGEWLEVSRELLSSSGPLRPTLDRNVSLYRPSSHVNQFDLSGTVS